MTNETFEESEKGTLSIDEKKLKDATRKLNEMEQERLLIEHMNNYLQKNEDISKEVFEEFSHELRTPIVTIKTYADMILDGAFGELTPLQKEKIQRVKENTELLIDVVMQMLDKIHTRK